MKINLKRLTIIVLILTGIDAILTLIGTSLGLQEGNPIFIGLFSLIGIEATVVLYAALISLIILFLYKVAWSPNVVKALFLIKSFIIVVTSWNWIISILMVI